MKLFRAQARENWRTEVLVCALTAEEASAYVKTLPLFWRGEWPVERFQEVTLPEGPSPSLLMQSYDGPATHD